MICSLLIWCWHWANSVYSTWNSSRTFSSHQGQARQFWYLWCLLFFLLLYFLSLFDGGNLRVWRWNRARSPPAQWVLNFFFIVLPKWPERSPILVFFNRLASPVALLLTVNPIVQDMEFCNTVYSSSSPFFFKFFIATLPSRPEPQPVYNFKDVLLSKKKILIWQSLPFNWDVCHIHLMWLFI